MNFHFVSTTVHLAPHMGEPQNCNATVPGSSTQVKATLCLGQEKYYVNGTNFNGVLLSEQLVTMKQESMMILKDFITKHNIPADVPDEAVEEEDDDSGEAPLSENNHPERTKKRK